MRKIYIEERAVELAYYIIDGKDTVRGAAKKFGISKSIVHMDVTLKTGKENGQVIPESIEIRGVCLFLFCHILLHSIIYLIYII